MAKENQISPDALLKETGERKEGQETKRFKLTKEHLDRVRHIEGFPIAKDEDIISLSDPPYYTACPNQFTGDFIKEHGKPYDPDSDDYRRQPLSLPTTTTHRWMSGPSSGKPGGFWMKWKKSAAGCVGRSTWWMGGCRRI